MDKPVSKRKKTKSGRKKPGLKKYLLKMDYPTSKGVLKANKDYLWLNDEAAKLLTKKKII